MTLIVVLLLATSCGKDSPLAPVAGDSEETVSRDRPAEPLPPDSTFDTQTSPAPTASDTLRPAPPSPL